MSLPAILAKLLRHQAELAHILAARQNAPKPYQVCPHCHK